MNTEWKKDLIVKKLPVVVAAGLAATTLTGCGELTTEEIKKNIDKCANIEKVFGVSPETIEELYRIEEILSGPQNKMDNVALINFREVLCENMFITGKQKIARAMEKSGLYGEEVDPTKIKFFASSGENDKTISEIYYNDAIIATSEKAEIDKEIAEIDKEIAEYIKLLGKCNGSFKQSLEYGDFQRKEVFDTYKKYIAEEYEWVADNIILDEDRIFYVKGNIKVKWADSKAAAEEERSDLQ